MGDCYDFGFIPAKIAFSSPSQKKGVEVQFFRGEDGRKQRFGESRSTARPLEGYNLRQRFLSEGMAFSRECSLFGQIMWSRPWFPNLCFQCVFPVFVSRFV